MAHSQDGPRRGRPLDGQGAVRHDAIATMATVRSFVAPLVPFFVLYLAAMVGEWALLTQRRGAASHLAYDWREATVNVVSWATAMVAWFPINVATYLTSRWLWQFRAVDLGVGVGAWVAAALAWDLSFYWQHRAEHQFRLLWAGHVTHHSSERFNYSTGFRQSWTPWTGPIFYSAWALLGV